MKKQEKVQKFGPVVDSCKVPSPENGSTDVDSLDNNFVREESGVIDIYARQMARYQRLSSTEERALIEQRKNGSKAKMMKVAEKLLLHNWRYVLKVAHSCSGRGLPLEDLVSEGNIATFSIAIRYKKINGVRFVTYAGLAIRRRMMRAIDRYSRTVRIPDHAIGYIVTIRKMEEQYLREHGCRPTDQKLASITGLSLKLLRALRYSMNGTVSLDNQVQPDSDATYRDIIADLEASDPSAVCADQDDYRQLRIILGFISEQQREIVMARFGLGNGGEVIDRIKLAKKFKVSTERISQIERLAIRRLKFFFGIIQKYGFDARQLAINLKKAK